MAGAMRLMGVMLMVVMPGGLLVLFAFILGRQLAEQVKLEAGSRGQRLARAVVHVRLRDVWAQARKL